MSRPRIAVTIMPLDNRRDVLVSTAVAAERRGFEGFFLPETWALDTTVVLAEAAVKTERITLGTGILNVWSRSPGTLAMTAATLA
ncbi:MAG: LLM class flavin-dependent oxidoreductase, partial [Candidatus Rokuibacteriota bacterium]